MLKILVIYLSNTGLEWDDGYAVVNVASDAPSNQSGDQRSGFALVWSETSTDLNLTIPLSGKFMKGQTDILAVIKALEVAKVNLIRKVHVNIRSDFVKRYSCTKEIRFLVKGYQFVS
jgi:hypothetical protein